MPTTEVITLSLSPSLSLPIYLGFLQFSSLLACQPCARPCACLIFCLRRKEKEGCGVRTEGMGPAVCIYHNWIHREPARVKCVSVSTGIAS